MLAERSGVFARCSVNIPQTNNATQTKQQNKSYFESVNRKRICCRSRGLAEVKSHQVISQGTWENRAAKNAIIQHLGSGSQ